jgi:DNA-binding PadR family transcriptional regulator
MKDLSRTQREVLAVLSAAGSTHAYEIKLRLRDVLGHSSVYAALASAEAKGFLRSEWEDPAARPPGSGPARKYFELTDLGREALAAAEANRLPSRSSLKLPRGEATT